MTEYQMSVIVAGMSEYSHSPSGAQSNKKESFRVSNLFRCVIMAL